MTLCATQGGHYSGYLGLTDIVNNIEDNLPPALNQGHRKRPYTRILFASDISRHSTLYTAPKNITVSLLIQHVGFVCDVQQQRRAAAGLQSGSVVMIALPHCGDLVVEQQ